MSYINEDIFWALTPSARKAMVELIKDGLDPDLALQILESKWEEEDIWALDQEEDNAEEI